MKVKKTEAVVFYTYDKIAEGVAFHWGGSLFLKLKDRSSRTKDNYAANLETGQIITFDAFVEVQPMEAHVTIEGPAKKEFLS